VESGTSQSATIIISSLVRNARPWHPRSARRWTIWRECWADTTNGAQLPEVRDIRPQQNGSRPTAGIAIVPAILISLAGISILSKKPLTPYPWLISAAFLVPIPIALFFRKEIALAGVWLYTAVLIGVLAAVVLFGV
jgi:hypothetical protein